jgi:hypothetical protein
MGPIGYEAPTTPDSGRDVHIRCLRSASGMRDSPTTMPPKIGTRRWVPVPIPWEGIRVSGDGRRLLVVYVTGDGQPADCADVGWDRQRLTVTLSRMRTGSGGKLAAIYHCVEVRVSEDASAHVVIDGSTGEQASAKRSVHLAPGPLRPRTLDSVFEPQELLAPRERRRGTPAEVGEVEPRWRPVPVEWEGVRLTADGQSLLAVYITGSPKPADRADVRRDQRRLTLTLSRVFEGEVETAAAIYHCVEVPLSQHASDRILVDGTTGERANKKRSHYLDPGLLRGTERTLDSVFEPGERLEPREITT